MTSNININAISNFNIISHIANNANNANNSTNNNNTNSQSTPKLEVRGRIDTFDSNTDQSPDILLNNKKSLHIYLNKMKSKDSDLPFNRSRTDS